MTLARRICRGERGDFREICAVEVTTSSNNFSYFLSDLNLVAIQQHFLCQRQNFKRFYSDVCISEEITSGKLRTFREKGLEKGPVF